MREQRTQRFARSLKLRVAITGRLWRPPAEVPWRKPGLLVF